MPSTSEVPVVTPLGADYFSLLELTGTEAISSLFSFRLRISAQNSAKDTPPEVDFSALLGKEMTFAVPINTGDDQAKQAFRRFSGICIRLSQEVITDAHTEYLAELVPEVWLLQLQTRSRIFQRLNVPDILKAVLPTTNVVYNLTVKSYEPREYCVQYNESDFDFASRLMEEEGIFYFFEFTDENIHKMIVCDSDLNHQPLPGTAEIHYDVASMVGRESDSSDICEWKRSQVLRSGAITLRDFNFQLPGKNLEAKKTPLATAQTGTVSHTLNVSANSSREVYEYPGGYAKRFDGIDKSGGDQAANLQKIFDDNARTANLRAQAQTVGSVLIRGASKCNNFIAGGKFTFCDHPDGNGDYILTSVTHQFTSAHEERSGESYHFSYSNEFTCIPSSIPFRPQRVTPKPTTLGVQTAIVVGPSGEEIFTDKYGRVKVQFPWDRDGTNDATSSCWLRVSTLWAGKQWGMIHLPRIGNEVIVDFVHGDPDCPIVTGCVYSPANMPPWVLPDHKTQSGVMSRSTTGGAVADCNIIRFEDKKGAEQIFINAQFDSDLRVENDSREIIGNDHHVIVTRDERLKISGKLDEHIVGNVTRKEDGNVAEHIVGNETRKVDGNVEATIGGNDSEKITGNHGLNVVGSQAVKVGTKQSINVGTSREAKIGTNEAVEAGTNLYLKGGTNVVIEAGVSLTIKVGSNFINIGPSGVSIQGTMVMINSGGAAGQGTAPSPDAPAAPAAPADPVDPDTADDGTKAAKLK